MNEAKLPPFVMKLERPTRLNEDKIEALQAFFPSVFSDGKLNLETLKEELRDGVVEVGTDNEYYGLNWSGKRSAKKKAFEPYNGTLQPVIGMGMDENTTKNMLIEGDNLGVLKTLLKSYAGRVKMIYIDPPYNTGKDFVYSDDYSESVETYLRRTNQADDEGLLTSNPRASGRFHSKWLDTMYPRLLVARELLNEEGVIFVSIDDNEVFNLRNLMNEVFGEENFITTIIWQKVYAPKNSAKHFSGDHDYVLVYAKNGAIWRPRLLPRTEEADALYKNPDADPRDVWMSDNLTARNFYSDGQYEVVSPAGNKYKPPLGSYWRFSQVRFEELNEDRRIWWGAEGGNMPRLKRFLSEVKQGVIPQTLWFYQDVGHTQEAKQELLQSVSFEQTDNVIDSVKPTRLIQRMLQIVTEPHAGDIVLDFFAGTGTTGHAVLKQNQEDGGNRQVILVQLPVPLEIKESKLETIFDVTKMRVTNVGAKFKTEGGKGDLGFRVFKLDSSNLRAWRAYDGTDPAALTELFSQHSPLVSDWKPENVLTELMLIQGYPLDSKVEQNLEFLPNVVHTVTHPDFKTALHVCLGADLVSDPLLAAVSQHKNDTFICLDSALTDDLKVSLADRVKRIVTL